MFEYDDIIINCSQIIEEDFRPKIGWLHDHKDGDAHPCVFMNDYEAQIAKDLNTKIWRVINPQPETFIQMKKAGDPEVEVNFITPAALFHGDGSTLPPFPCYGPPVNDNYKALREAVRERVDYLRKIGNKSHYYIFGNEPTENGGFWSGTRKQWIEANKAVYLGVMDSDPEAIFGGGELADPEDKPGIISSWWQALAEAFNEAGMKLNFLTCHFYPSRENAEKFAELRSKYPGLEISELWLTEYPGMDDSAALMVKYFMDFHDNGFDKAARSYLWDMAGNVGIVDMHDTVKKSYWPHKWYSLMSGSRIRTCCDDIENLPVVAVYNKKRSEIRILFGNRSKNERKVRFIFNKWPFNDNPDHYDLLSNTGEGGEGGYRIEQIKLEKDSGLELELQLNPDQVSFIVIHVCSEKQEPDSFMICQPAKQQMSLDGLNEQATVFVPLLPTVTWFASLHAEYYQVQISEDFEFSKIHTDVSGISQTFFTLKNPLQHEKTYWVRVWALNGSKRTSASNSGEFKMLSLDIHKPSGFSLENPADGAAAIHPQCRFSWGASQRAEDYRLIVSLNEDLSDTVIDTFTGNRTTFTLPEEMMLEPGNKYYWRVWAVNPFGTTSASGGHAGFKICNPKTPFTSDEFDNLVPGDNWTFINEDCRYWSLIAQPGFLRLSMFGDLQHDLCKSKNIVLQKTPSEDFSVRTILRLEGTLTDGTQCGGVLVYQDDSNLIALVRGWGNKGRKIIAIEKLNGICKLTEIDDIEIQSHPIALRIDKSGRNYSLYYCHSSEWCAIPAHISGVDFKTPLVGLGAFGLAGDHMMVDFDCFHDENNDSQPGNFMPVSPSTDSLQLKRPLLRWTSAKNTLRYLVEIFQSSELNKPLESSIVGTNSYSMENELLVGAVYYWNVTAINYCGKTNMSVRGCFKAG